MSRELKTVEEAATVAHAAELLYSAEVKRLPVTRDGKVVGMLSRSDVIRALGRLGTEARAQSVPDPQIREALRMRVARVGWVSPQQVRFRVKDGSGEAEGVITSEDQRLALHALVEGVPGVKHVIDRLQVTTSLTANPA
jgi:CBS domain-containing protein